MTTYELPGAAALPSKSAFAIRCKRCASEDVTIAVSPEQVHEGPTIHACHMLWLYCRDCEQHEVMRPV